MHSLQQVCTTMAVLPPTLAGVDPDDLEPGDCPDENGLTLPCVFAGVWAMGSKHLVRPYKTGEAPVYCRIVQRAKPGSLSLLVTNPAHCSYASAALGRGRMRSVHQQHRFTCRD